MLKDKIQEDLNQAIKRKDETACSTLRGVLASVLSKEKDKRYKISKEEQDPEKLDKESKLTEEEFLHIVSSEAKKRKEAIIEYEKGGRTDLAEKEKAELGILEKYLPEQLSEEEIKAIVKQAIKETGASDMKDMGKVMAKAMPKAGGRADGSEISKIVKELLSQDD